MDHMKLLVEDLEANQTWPPLNLTSDELRLLSARRRRLRGIALGAALVALGALVVAMPVSGWLTQDQVAVSPAAEDDVRSVKLAGASLDIPSSWTELSRSSNASVVEVCVGPSASSEDCPVVLSALANPAEVDLAGGLDPAATITEDCRADDPKIVNVEGMVIDGRQATRYSARCVPEGSAITAWALNSGGLMITVADERWVTDAARIFSTVQIPEDWPEVQGSSAPSSAAPSSR